MTRASWRQWLDGFETSYWFVPVIAAIVAVILAQILLWMDEQIPNHLLIYSSLVYTATPQEARTAMIGLAGTVLGTAGIVFSLLTLPMSVAASQFGSRLLRLYLRDRTTQFVLGVFTGTFVYCLMVALSIPPAEVVPDAPQLATTMGLALILVAFFSLIALIHHIGTSLEAPNVAAAASQELRDVIGETWSSEAAHPVSDNMIPAERKIAHLKEQGHPIYATSLGYIQAIDPQIISPIAVKHDLVIRLLIKPGGFVRQGELLAMVYPPQSVTPRLAETIRNCYHLGNLRTPAQDVEYAVNQLVEMGVRAMSPAINDPFTAITCLHHLGAGLSYYVTQRAAMDSNVISQSRIILSLITLGELLDAAFHLFRRTSRESPDVLLALLNALDVIGCSCDEAGDRAEIARHLELVKMESDASASTIRDKERVNLRYEELIANYSKSLSVNTSLGNTSLGSTSLGNTSP